MRLMPASHAYLHQPVRARDRSPRITLRSWRGRMAISSRFRGLRSTRMPRRALAVGAGLALAATLSASAVAAPSAGTDSSAAAGDVPGRHLVAAEPVDQRAQHQLQVRAAGGPASHG